MQMGFTYQLYMIIIFNYVIIFLYVFTPSHTEESGYSLPRKRSTATVPKFTHTLCNVTLNVSNHYPTFWVDLPTGNKVKERIWVQYNLTYIVLVGTYMGLGELFCGVFSTKVTQS